VIPIRFYGPPRKEEEMSYKRNQRRKWQYREQPAWYVTVPEWGRVHRSRGRDVQITHHPLAGLKFRGAGTAAHLRKFREQGVTS